MKNAKKLLLSLVALVAVSTVANAQAWKEDPRYGNTEEEREQTVKTMNYFKDAFDSKNYELATNYMHQLMETAPKATMNIYIRGGNIYKAKINQSKSLSERNLYLDSLMWVADKRVEAFGDHPEQGKGYILTQKAKDFIFYNTKDRDRIKKYFNEAIDATDGKESEFLNSYFQVVTEDYQSDLIETEEVMSEFERISGLMEKSDKPEEGQKILEQLLVASGAADCENLEKIYRPQYEADPNNVELLTKIVGLFGRSKCEGDFQLMAAENLYKVSPTPETGLALATIFEARGDYEKSLYYWEESINNEPDPSKKADYMMRAAVSALGDNNNRQAAAFAQQALSIDSNNGLAYMIRGQAMAASVTSSCSDDFARRTAYWIVVDNLQKARTLLAGDAERVESLNKMIGSYSGSFPNDEELFFRSLKSGDSYTVNCGWISGTTTVRAVR